MVRVQREMAEIERDQVLGNPVLITDAQAIISRYLLVMKNKLLGLGAKLAPLANPAAPLVAQRVIYDGVVKHFDAEAALDSRHRRGQGQMGAGGMKPLGLSDSQYDAVVRACEPLAPADRSRFLVELPSSATASSRV